MTWKNEVINALQNLGGEAHLKEIYTYIKSNSKRKLTKSYEAIIRRTIETNSKDSQAFEGKEDLFYSVNGIGNGKWGLKSFKSSEYLKERNT
jgi:putative restriction endonuclease